MMCDRKSKYKAAIVMKQKGVEEYSVKRVVDVIRKLGYNRIILKSDQEHSETALRQAIKRTLSGEVEIVPEESPVGEHASNGEVENAIKVVQGMIRTIKDGLETKYKMKLPTNHRASP